MQFADPAGLDPFDLRIPSLTLTLTHQCQEVLDQFIGRLSSGARLPNEGKRLPDERVRGSHGHSAPPSAILQQGYRLEAHIGLEAIAQL